MNKEQVALAVNSGLELLGPESEVQVPAKLNDGVFFLRQFLTMIGQGRLAIVPATQKEGDETPPAPPAPNRQQRRAAASKKRSKKKVSKKKS